MRRRKVRACNAKIKCSMSKLLSFAGRQQLLRIPPGLRCFARSFIEKLRAEEKELAGAQTTESSLSAKSKADQPDWDDAERGKKADLRGATLGPGAKSSN